MCQLGIVTGMWKLVLSFPTKWHYWYRSAHSGGEQCCACRKNDVPVYQIQINYGKAWVHCVCSITCRCCGLTWASAVCRGRGDVMKPCSSTIAIRTRHHTTCMRSGCKWCATTSIACTRWAGPSLLWQQGDMVQGILVSLSAYLSSRAVVFSRCESSWINYDYAIEHLHFYVCLWVFSARQAEQIFVLNWSFLFRQVQMSLFTPRWHAVPIECACTSDSTGLDNFRYLITYYVSRDTWHAWITFPLQYIFFRSISVCIFMILVCAFGLCVQ